MSKGSKRGERWSLEERKTVFLLFCLLLKIINLLKENENERTYLAILHFDILNVKTFVH